MDNNLKSIKDLPKRKRTRLPEFDYSSNGIYFVTICTQNRRKILSEIFVGQGLGPAEIRLLKYGQIAEKQIFAFEERFDNVKIENHVIMPDHIHLLVNIKNFAAEPCPCPTLSDVVCAFKSLTTRECKQKHKIEKLFQTSFYEHIIRNEQDFKETFEYIERNPYRWIEENTTPRI